MFLPVAINLANILYSPASWESAHCACLMSLQQLCNSAYKNNIVCLGFFNLHRNFSAESGYGIMMGSFELMKLTMSTTTLFQQSLQQCLQQQLRLQHWFQQVFTEYFSCGAWL